jgi:serine protease
MKLTGTAVLILSCILSAYGQGKSSRHYSFPAGVTQNDVVSGRVLVKIKPQYKSVFESGAANGRSALRSTGIRRLSSGKSSGNPAGRAMVLKPVIDITQYYEIKFNPAESVENFLNKMYETGYVEYAEPVYKEQMQFTPNDALISGQYYLPLIKANQAWDLTQGSEEIIIAIIDSGVDIDHPEIASQLYENDDPINGIDDDNNGYVDDIHGWDFSGDDVNNIYEPDFVGDNNPAIFTSGPGFNHGTSVGSLAAGATNNGTGMAGVGFKSKLMFTKHYADNQAAASRDYNSNLYFGVIYAAENGARIINCSWGGPTRSQIYQDIITYATLDRGCLIVAAAGNSNNAVPLYPASYDHVISVASTDANDKRAFFSSYGSTVDISAPGTGLTVAEFDNRHVFAGSGTSFSAPMVSGAAALLLALHPEYTALELGEQLRVTADVSMYDQNPTFLNQLGRGRLDIYRALTIESASVRATNFKLLNDEGLTAEAGQHAYLSLDFTNHLKPTSPGLTITVTTLSATLTITKSVFAAGTIASGAIVNNENSPFELDINGSIGENVTASVLITYEDVGYTDTQVITFVPNPSYRHIDDNLITTSISSSGRLGYENPNTSTGGNGFIFDDRSLMYEMGIILGGSTATVLNTLRNAASGFDQDFVSTAKIREINPGERSYTEIFGSFSNSTTPASQTVQVSYRSLVWRETPYDKFVILEYKIKNPQAAMLTNFHFGIFADWDISFSGAEDAANWNAETQMGYVYPKLLPTFPQAGIQLLTGSGNYYAIDNDQSIAGNPFGIYDGYTDAEKFASISTSRLQAGNATATGNDVSHVISAGPYTINGGEEITIAFALHAGNSVDDLIASAKYADTLYNQTLQAPKPVTDTVETCYGADATLTATGASAFKWYAEFTGGEPLATGTALTVNNLFKDTTLYVSNADESYESVRTPSYVSVQAKPQIVAEGPTSICGDGEVILSVDSATAYDWSNGLTTRSISVNEPGAYSVVVTYVSDDLDCQSSSDAITVETLAGPTSAFSFSGGDPRQGLPLQFADESMDAVSWKWDFGDGNISTDQNPSHTFDESGSFNVTLTVMNSNGCKDIADENIAVVTDIEGGLSSLITVYPNPSHQANITVSVEGVSVPVLELTLLNAQGLEMYAVHFNNIQPNFSTTLPTAQYSPGMYVVLLKIDNRTVAKKILLGR